MFNEGDSKAIFPATPWTLLRDAPRQPAEAQRELLERLLLHYWKPMYAFYRSHGVSRHDAADLVQELLLRWLKRPPWNDVQEGRGRFRDWLLACCQNHWRTARRRGRAAKRMPPGGLASLDVFTCAGGAPFEPATHDPPDQAFHEAWRRQLIERALQAVVALCRQKDRLGHYQLFADYYLAADDSKPTWRILADKYGLASWKEATHRAEWVKEQLARAIRDQIAGYADSDEDVDGEIRELLQ